MVSFQVKQLTDPTESQTQEVIDVLTDAFSKDTGIIRAFLGGNWDLLRDFMTAVARACLLEGIVYIVTIENEADEKIVSVGCWLGNGVQLFGSEEQRALGYYAFSEKISDETKHWVTEVFPPQATKLTQSHFTEEEIAKRWWCILLATRSEHQRKGYGSAIVQTMFNKAEAEGTFIALSASSERNVKKYLSMGFELRGQGGPVHSPIGDFWLHYLTKGSLA